MFEKNGLQVRQGASTGQALKQVVAPSDLSTQQINRGVIPSLVPAATTNPAINQVDSVMYTPSLTQGVNQLEDAMIYSLDNSASGTARNFVMFDANGMYAAASAAALVAGVIEGDATFTTAILKNLSSQQIAFKGYSVEAQNNASSLANGLFSYQVLNNKLIIPNRLTQSIGQRNTQFNLQLQTFDFDTPVVILGNVALVMRVPAGEVITFTWFYEAVYSRYIS